MTGNREWDCIVIGAGLSGLTAAAYLARAGNDVVVVEQQGVPGGCCSGCSDRDPGAIPALHHVRGHDRVNGILGELGAGSVEFRLPDPVFRVVGPSPGAELVVSPDRQSFISSARALAPDVPGAEVDERMEEMIRVSLAIHEEAALVPLEGPETTSFIKRLAMGFSVRNRLAVSMEYGQMPLSVYLTSRFAGEGMQALRGALQAVPRIRNPRAIDLLAIIGDVLTAEMGVPEGGIETIIRRLAGAITAAGGEIRTGSKVASIGVVKGAVTGVALADGTVLPAPDIISTVDMKTTFFSLLPANIPPRLLKDKLGKITLSDPCFTVTVGTSIPVIPPGTDRSTVYLVSSPATAVGEAPSPDPQNVPFSISFPDPTAGMAGAVQLMAPVQFVYGENWHSGPGFERTPDHDAFARSSAETLVQRAGEILPGLSSHVSGMSIVTPVDYQAFTGNDMGAPYGWRRPRMWRQAVPYVHGLYLAGHWTYPGPGVLNVMMSGKNAAHMVLPGV